MGFNHTSNLCSFLFLVLLLISSFAAYSTQSASSHEVLQAMDAPSSFVPSRYQVFYIKNAAVPFLLNKQEFNKRKVLQYNREKKMKINNYKFKNSFNGRPFSAMLPKGLVPPSGSSPCHNDFPDSATFIYCDLSNQKP